MCQLLLIVLHLFKFCTRKCINIFSWSSMWKLYEGVFHTLRWSAFLNHHCSWTILGTEVTAGLKCPDISHKINTLLFSPGKNRTKIIIGQTSLDYLFVKKEVFTFWSSCSQTQYIYRKFRSPVKPCEQSGITYTLTQFVRNNKTY